MAITAKCLTDTISVDERGVSIDKSALDRDGKSSVRIALSSITSVELKRPNILSRESLVVRTGSEEYRVRVGSRNRADFVAVRDAIVDAIAPQR